jgi:hypothetical protein
MGFFPRKEQPGREGDFNNFLDGGPRMKKAEGSRARTRKFILEIPGIKLNAKEKKALQAAVKAFNEQSERLGLLDPLDAEPAAIFFAEEGTR